MNSWKYIFSKLIYLVNILFVESSQVTESDNELGEVNMNHNLEKHLFYLHAGTVAHIPTFS